MTEIHNKHMFTAFTPIKEVRSMSRMMSLALLGLVITGCGTTEPVWVRADYGLSVKRMVSAQTLNPLVSANPSREPVMGLDGVKSGGILQNYRKEVSEPAQINNIINIGTAGGG